jgi:Short C-terminal domain
MDFRKPKPDFEEADRRFAELKRPDAPEPRMEASYAVGTIHIKRESRFTGSLVSLRVSIDGREVGRLRNGEEGEFSAPPGMRDVLIKARTVGSKRLTVEVQAGKTTHFVCMATPVPGRGIEAYQLASASQPSMGSPSRSSSEISPLEELEQLATLRDKGIITEEEFNAKKKQLLGL